MKTFKRDRNAHRMGPNSPTVRVIREKAEELYKRSECMDACNAPKECVELLRAAGDVLSDLIAPQQQVSVKQKPFKYKKIGHLRGCIVGKERAYYAVFYKAGRFQAGALFNSRKFAQRDLYRIMRNNNETPDSIRKLGRKAPK